MKVRCINNNVHDTLIKIGSIYEVVKQDEDHYWLKGIDYGFWKHRFEVVEEFKEYRGEESNLDKVVEQLESINTESHYKGVDSLYKFCEQWKLNAYEFDIIKRVVRCRHKGNFEDDLRKTKNLIDIYLKEYGS